METEKEVLWKCFGRQWAVSYIVNYGANRKSSHSLLGIYLPKRKESKCPYRGLLQTFIRALFVTAPDWKPPSPHQQVPGGRGLRGGANTRKWESLPLLADWSFSKRISHQVEVFENIFKLIFENRLD